MKYAYRKSLRSKFRFTCHIRRFSPFVLFMTTILVSVFGNQVRSFSQGWSDLMIRLLPDSSFAVIEADENGRRHRRCPHHDLNGKLDVEQLIYVLGTFNDTKWFDAKNRNAGRKHLEKHYNKFKSELMKKGLPRSLNINKAKLSELVALPNIGPILAVKIVEYRNTHPLFRTIEDIKKVEGIGYGTLNAIKHYIKAN